MVFGKRIRDHIRQAFSQGLTSCELATCLTIAALATTFPIFGLTTIVVTAIAVRKKLNLPLLILITYSLEPLRFLIFIPLTEAGSFILNNPQDLTIESVKNVYNQGFMGVLMFLTHQLVYALIGWTVIVIPLAYPFFHIVKKSIGFSIPKTKECV